MNKQGQDKDKLYSVHAPEVECIAKGKAHKKYEFGVKVGITDTRSKEVFVDLGYRGVDLSNVTIYKTRQKRSINTRRLKLAKNVALSKI